MYIIRDIKTSTEIAEKMIRSGYRVVLDVNGPDSVRIECSWFPPDILTEVELDRHWRNSQ